MTAWDFETLSLPEGKSFNYIEKGNIVKLITFFSFFLDNPWDCSSDLKWILDSSIKDKLVNMTGIMCRDDNPGPGKPGKPVFAVMSLIEVNKKKYGSVFFSRFK